MIAVIPAYEPDKKLEKIAAQLYNSDFRIVIVNDGSSNECDSLFDGLKKYAVVLSHKENQGKGRAIKTALEFTLKFFPFEDGVVTVDADGQHKLPDIISVCDALKSNRSKLILGARHFEGRVPFRSRFGNSVTKGVFALASGKKLSDTQTGLRAFSCDMIPFLLEIPGERYEFEMNVLLSCAETGIDWVEIPIETVYLDEKNSSSHFNPLKDSLKIYGCILKFSCSSFLSFLLDFALFNLLVNTFFLGSFAADVMLSNVLARVVSSFFNYHLNRKYVFRANGGAMTASKYFLLAVGILISNTVLLEILTALAVLPFAAKILTEIILFICSLLVQRFVIFRPVKAE